MNTKLLIIMLLSCCFGCDDRTQADLIKDEYISNRAHGIIREVELWKGCLLVINFEDGNKVGLLDACSLFNVIKSRDSLVKFKNSAKGLIYRKDSLFPINSITPKSISKQDLDSVGTFEFWNEKVVNKWYSASKFKY